MNGETWNDVISTTLSEKELEEPIKYCVFVSGGIPFYLWTKSRVYFSVSTRDDFEGIGSDYVASVPRNVTHEPPSNSV